MQSLKNLKLEQVQISETIQAVSTNISQIVEKFDLFKENFNAKQNFYINYFFFFFGDHYESMINSVNFFHYATESILLEMLKKLGSQDFLNSKGEVLLNYIREIKVNNEDYYENIKLLTGSGYFYDFVTKISEIKIATVFLQKFYFYKEKEVVKLENDEVALREFNFESLFTMILQKATSSTLYEIRSIPLKNDEIKNLFEPDLLFYFCANEIKNKNNFILINFVRSIQNYTELNFKILNEKNLMNIIKMYYFYSKTKLEDFLFDLELFGDYSSSLYEKIKKISVKNYEKLNTNFKNTLKRTVPYENLKSFYTQISCKISDSAGLVKSKISSLKIWINESIKKSPNFFYDKFRISRIFLYDKVLQPSKNFLVLFTDRYTTFLFTNIRNVKKVSSDLSDFFLEKAEALRNNFEHKVNEIELFIRLTADEKINFVKVDLDNTFMMINPKRLKIYIDDLYNRMRQYSLELLEISKFYIISKYKLFLGEDETNS